MPLEQADLQALAQALKDLQPAASVNATAVKLPQFWPGNPEVWFKQIESVFTTRNLAITTQQTRFNYVVQSLDNSTAGMKNLNADPSTLFKAFFLAQLPPDVRKILATSGKTDIDELAIEADRIVEVSRLSNDSQVNAAGYWKRTDNPLTNGIHSPMASTRQWHPLANSLSPHPTPMVTRPTGRMDAPRASNKIKWRIVPGLCRKHSQFGELAYSCTPPCKFLPNTDQGNSQAGQK